MFDERGDISKTIVALTPDGDPVEAPTERPPEVPPPCSACPKWERQPGDPAPLDGAVDLFGTDWFHDCRESFLEGRAVGDFGDPDPFMRGVLAEFDQAERRLERLRAGDTLAAVARLMTRR